MLRFLKEDGTDYPVWKKKKLGEIALAKTGEKPVSISKFPTEYEYINAGTSPSGYVEFYNCEGDTVTTPSRGQGGLGYIGYQEKRFWLGPLCYKIQATIPSVLTKYVYYYLFIHNNLVLDLKKVGTIPAINREDLVEVQIKLPCLEEQQKIVDCLSSADAVIADYEAQVKSLQNQKKGVMQKLFLQETRFKADDGSDYPDWNKSCFSEHFDFVSNNTLSRDCLNYEMGSTKNIHYGDVLIKYGSIKDVNNEDVPYINEDVELKSPAFLKNGDIIIADTAEDETCGKAVEISGIGEKDAVAGLHTMACRPKHSFAEGYMGYYINSEAYRKQLYRLMQGTKVTSLNRKNIEDSVMIIPCIEEQQKISNCLSAFDDAIEDLQKTVEHWKRIKKGLLQQLFV